MSTTANDILEQVKLATNFQVNKKLLKEKIMADMHIPYNGGMFKLSPELFAFVQTWPESELFLEDVYENPIKIIKSEFLIIAQSKYKSIMNEWHIQYEQLRKVRKI